VHDGLGRGAFFTQGRPLGRIASSGGLIQLSFKAASREE
jgi:hypothetical protein